MADTQSYYPSRWQATQLWQAYVNNVDPIAKILHIPTTQTTFFAAINNPSEIDDDLNALLFSIYFSATTSLTSTDAAHILGQDKSIALRMYKQGLEQSLTCANILETPSLRSLQAMTIYLVSVSKGMQEFMRLTYNLSEESSRLQWRSFNLDIEWPCYPVRSVNRVTQGWKELQSFSVRIRNATAIMVVHVCKRFPCR